MPSTSSSNPLAGSHTANLLGALALVLADRTADAISEPTGLTTNDAVALSALRHFLDRPSIDQLAKVLGLTHSGAVRLVDRLTAAGLVTRQAGGDSRTTAVAMTTDGDEVARLVTSARTGVLKEALAPLSVEDRHALDAILGVVLAGLVRAPGATRWICRLCDTDACGRSLGQCPVAREARHRYS